MSNGQDKLVKRLRAKDEEIAEWKRKLALTLFGEASTAPAADSEHPSKQETRDDTPPETASSSDEVVSQVSTTLSAARQTPCFGTSAAAGTAADPLEILDSEDDSEHANMLPKFSSHPPSLNGTQGDSKAATMQALDVIELYDSGEGGDVKDVVIEKTRKRGREAPQAHPKPALSLKGEVSEEEPESLVLSAASRRKQRKLNHAVLEQQDVKLPVGSMATSVSHYRMRYNLHGDVIGTENPKEGKEEEDWKVATSDTPQVSAQADSPEPVKDEYPIEDGTLEGTRSAITRLRNPEAQVKKEYLLKDEDVLQLHLSKTDALQPYSISLPDDLRSVTVRRELLAKRYGGSSMDTFPGPSAEKLAQHGRGNLMCINLLWNPHAPQVPGHAGLYFDTILPGDPWTARKGHSERQTLFVKIKAGKWLYLGEYEAHPAPSLTVAQWHGLADAVRGVWTKNISEKDWGRTLRARIHLRRTLGREPTRAEVDSADGLFKHITREQVDDALGAGHECIRAWSMKCIGYDEDFQREVIELSRGEI